MILTYSLKHGRDFGEPGQAKKTAGFAIRTKSNTGRDARHIGLIRNCKPDPAKVQEHRIKKATNVKPAMQGQPIKYDSTAKTAGIPCLGLELDCSCLPGFQKIRQVGIGKKLRTYQCKSRNQKPKDLKNSSGWTATPRAMQPLLPYRTQAKSTSPARWQFTPTPSTGRQEKGCKGTAGSSCSKR